jgi:hypothetical protein
MIMQDYIVVEVQTNDAGKVATIVTAYDDYWTAQQKYHTILAAASVSALPVHTAVILSPYGDIIDKKCYNRRTPEPAE